MKLLIIFTALLCGCSSNYKMEGVVEAFPDSEVVYTPTQSQDFVVRKPDGSIWYVRCDNPFTKGITSKAMIMRGRK